MTEMLFAQKELKPDLLNSAKRLSETAWKNLSQRVKAVEPFYVGPTLVFGATGLVYTVASLHGFHEVGQIMHAGTQSVLQGAKDYFQLFKDFVPQTMQESRMGAAGLLIPTMATVFDGLTGLFGGKAISPRKYPASTPR